MSERAQPDAALTALLKVSLWCQTLSLKRALCISSILQVMDGASGVRGCLSKVSIERSMMYQNTWCVHRGEISSQARLGACPNKCYSHIHQQKAWPQIWTILHRFIMAHMSRLHAKEVT